MNSNISIDNSINKERLAIIVVGYNRLESLKRLVDSLDSAIYDVSAPLVFCIDASNNQELYSFVNNYSWSHGDKYVFIQTERQGLRKHIYFCGDLSRYFKGVIILEDDLMVSKSYYMYALAALNEYEEDERVAGIALYADSANGYSDMLPIYRYNDGSDGYMLQEVCTSGECFSEKMWSAFRSWLSDNENVDLEQYEMPEQIRHWTHAWSKYYNTYIVAKNLFFVTPYTSLATNCGEAGVHSKTNLNFLHTSIVWGEKKEFTFRPFNDAVKYDIFGNLLGLGKYLNIEEDDLCVDLYGNKSYKNKKYLLSLYKLPYKVIKSFGLVLEPIEANVIWKIQGEDIYLYDISEARVDNNKKTIPLSVLTYYLRGLTSHLAFRYSFENFKNKIINKIKK